MTSGGRAEPRGTGLAGGLGVGEGEREVMPAGSSSHAGSVKKVLDARLGQALQSGSPADISAAYKALADLHFEMRNMAVADELYAFSALHSRGIESNNATMTSEYGSADADERYGGGDLGVSVECGDVSRWRVSLRRARACVPCSCLRARQCAPDPLACVLSSCLCAHPMRALDARARALIPGFHPVRQREPVGDATAAAGRQ